MGSRSEFEEQNYKKYLSIQVSTSDTLYFYVGSREVERIVRSQKLTLSAELILMQQQKHYPPQRSTAPRSDSQQL